MRELVGCTNSYSLTLNSMENGATGWFGLKAGCREGSRLYLYYACTYTCRRVLHARNFSIHKLSLIVVRRKLRSKFLPEIEMQMGFLHETTMEETHVKRKSIPISQYPRSEYQPIYEIVSVKVRPHN